MKFHIKYLLLICVLLAGASFNSAWADNVTYTFSSKSWAATSGGSAANWTSGKDGYSMQSGRGMQVTEGKSGANATSPTSLPNISQIVVTYSTNASSGAGSIAFQVGSGTAKTKSVTSSGGTSDRTLTYNFSPNETGEVKITVTCTTSSIYIKSVTITYTPPVPITSISGMASSASIEVYGTTTLTPTVLPANTTETVVWESGDTDVATVSNGVVTGVAPGTAIITAKSPTDKAIKAECTVTVTAATKVTTPSFSVDEGTYNEAQSVILSCVTDGATIRYTTDGTDPTSSSTVYSLAISVDKSMTIKTKAFKDGLTDSDVASATYTLKCVAPTFSPDASTLLYGSEITISSMTDGATIYYTTNGDDPTTGSTAYDSSSKPAIEANQTIKAIASKTGWSNSDISSAAYELKTPDNPTFSLAAGLVIKGSTLTLSSEEGISIRYTTDGTEPTASVGTVYSGPITINAAQTIKAVAYDGGGNTSSVVSKAYSVFVGDIVTFDASGVPHETNQSSNGISFTCSGVSSTDGIKFYKSTSTTFSTSNGIIKRIEFTCTASGTAQYGPGSFGTGAPSGYSYSGTKGTWSGNATSVSFTATNNQVRALLIKVYVARTAVPAFSVAAGEYTEAQNVELSCATDDAAIYYTTDGSTPTSSSTPYSSAISITKTQTLKAIAVYDGVESPVASATYTIAPMVTVSAAKLATYASNYDLDFSDVTGLEAYIAKDDEGAIVLEKVDKVPAGTGVLLRAKDITESTNFTVPTAATTDDVTGNLFKRGTGDGVASVVESTKHNYILNNVGGVIGFYRANGQTVARNRAYLQTTVEATRISLSFSDDETTSIKSMDNEQLIIDNGAVYDLQGRKVSKPTKGGLYIVNGKKVVIR